MKTLTQRIYERLLREAAQARPDDPYGEYLFAPVRDDLPPEARKEQNTAAEDDLYAALYKHYEGWGSSAWDGQEEEILTLLSQGKYRKLLEPPPGPYFRVISKVPQGTVATVLGIPASEVVRGKTTPTGGGILTPRGQTGGGGAGASGIMSWTTRPSPKWMMGDLGAGYLRQGEGTILVRAGGPEAGRFFVDPAEMARVGGLPHYATYQWEVISKGPVEFEAAAYHVGLGSPYGGDAAEGVLKELISAAGG